MPICQCIVQKMRLTTMRCWKSLKLPEQASFVTSVSNIRLLAASGDSHGHK